MLIDRCRRKVARTISGFSNAYNLIFCSNREGLKGTALQHLKESLDLYKRALPIMEVSSLYNKQNLFYAYVDIADIHEIRQSVLDKSSMCSRFS